MPDRHAWLIVYAGRSTGMPARTPTWRAGFGPHAGLARVAEDRLVDRVGRDAGARERRARGHAPSSTAVSRASAPPNLPIGVRTAAAQVDGLGHRTLLP